MGNRPIARDVGHAPHHRAGGRIETCVRLAVAFGAGPEHAVARRCRSGVGRELDLLDDLACSIDP